MAKNRFGFEIYDPLLIFDGNSKVENLVNQNLQDLFLFLGDQSNFQFSMVMDLCNQSLKSAQSASNLFKARQSVEDKLKYIVKGSNVVEKLTNAFDNRAQKINLQLADHIAKMLPEKSIAAADIGCGDGLVAYYLKKRLGSSISKFLIADVLDYRCSKVMDNTFTWNLLPANGYRHIEPENENFLYDLILIGTVLHHTENPESVINACYRSLKKDGLMVIVESCIGVDKKMASKYASIAGDNGFANTQQVNDYLSMNIDEQMMYGVFIDWFYNRVLHKNINIPFNFNSPENWNKLIEDFAGMNTEAVFFEGFDQITVPEFHTIHFYRKK